MLLKATASLLLIFILTACGSNETKVDTTARPATLSDYELAQRGSYLVSISGCNDCHTPKIMTPAGPALDSSKLLSGHPAGEPLPPYNQHNLQPGGWVLMAPDVTCFIGPWGISYAANLTSDSATGIGNWPEQNFIQAVRTGKHMGLATARPILPPMPWPGLGKMTDEDLKAVYVYLKSTVPIVNRVPQPVMPDSLVKMTALK